MRKGVPVVMICLLLACNNNEQKRVNYSSKLPEVFPAKPYRVAKNKLSPPEIIAAEEKVSLSTARPVTTHLSLNTSVAGTPFHVKAAAPKKCIPGKNGLQPPKIKQAVDSPFLAGLPEITPAKDAQINNTNTPSFGIFKVLQGLKTNDIFPLMQDKKGNLWIACFEGGVCKYDGHSFSNYSSAQGLSSDDVWSMLEDKNGNLWFGTLHGALNKFDGKTITHYGVSSGLDAASVISMLQDTKGNIWFGTDDGGVNKYDGKTFTHYTTTQGLAGNHVRSMVEDNNGDLWFATSEGLSRFDGYTFSNYTTAEGLSNANIMDVLKDHQGNIWISTYGGGVNKFDGQTFQVYSVEQGLPDSKVYNMLEDKAGNLWFCMYDEYLIKFDGKTFFQFGVEQGLSNNKVHSMLEDVNGTLWVGTNDGLCKYNGATFTNVNSGTATSQKVIINLFEDKSNNNWVSIYGDGIKKFNDTSVTQFTSAQGLTDNSVMCSIQDKDGAILIGTQFGGLNKYNGKYFTHFENFPGQKVNAIWTLCKDSKQRIWIGTPAGLFMYNGTSFKRFGTAQGLSSDDILSICEDDNGNLWLGTEFDGVINKLDLSHEAENYYPVTQYNIRQGNSLVYVYDIFQDNKANLWVGTSNNGVFKFDGTSFIHYTTAQGLSNNAINSIAQDRKGALWFLTENGLCRLIENNLDVNTHSSFFKNYAYNDGFIGVGSHYNTMIAALNGNILVGASNWLTSLNTANEIADTVKPTIQLTNISLLNENINWVDVQKQEDDALILKNGATRKQINFNNLTPWFNLPVNLQLHHSINNISFSFIGIALSKPKEVQYQYRLDGLDETTSVITKKNEANYNNLSPGKYLFTVKACNGDGIWGNEITYPFVILPAWWQTWWFKFTAAACIVVLVYFAMRWRIQQNFFTRLKNSERDKQLAELKQQKLELEMLALRAQMNPHFIFNSLNSISRFILRNDKFKASEYLAKFSRLIRLILQNSQEAFISLESDLESLQLYLELEALRFDNHFTFQIIVEKEIDADLVKIPALLIQPYAENAIWHGLMHKTEKGQLEIRLYKNDGMLCCKIADDGVGRKQSFALKNKKASLHKPMGLHITAKRMAMLEQQVYLKSSIEIIDLVSPDGKPCGTEVFIKFPISSN